MSLQAHLDAVVAALTERYTGLKTCRTHPGKFALDDLGSSAFRCPAALAALWEVTGIHENAAGDTELRAKISLAVVTAEARGMPREEAAVHLVTDISRWLPRQRFSTLALCDAEDITARNLYSGSARGRAVTLWHILFAQDIVLPADVADEYPPPTTLYVGLAPDIGTGHEDDYMLFGGDDD
jgi:hypothetical protein